MITDKEITDKEKQEKCTISEDKLKFALTKALPETLQFYPLTIRAMWKPELKTYTGYFVTDYEWPAIVQMVEDKLSFSELEKFTLERLNICDECGINDESKVRLFDRWEIRAQALLNIGFINYK